MSCKPRNLNTDTNHLDVTGTTDIHSGHMSLVQKVGKKCRQSPVFVKVIRSCFEHYAVISKDQLFKTHSTFLNLKNCVVTAVEDTTTHIRVMQNNFEGNFITLAAKDGESRKEWLNIMRSVSAPSSPCKIPISPTLSPMIPRSPIMQTLTETDEDDEEEDD
ncbi:hypothetical protein SNE40_017041 [Patella caerulea]|uniref:PH domain-containing protein n=1 Tax=Patella caerulea TaxID=87958 RepID=A0AAN8PDC3_PATCE